MDSVKKIGLYILIIIVIYLFVSFASYGFINKAYKNLNDYEILTNIPKIEVVESKATYVNGYVISKLTNDTGIELARTYVKLDLYSENDAYLGTKYSEIRDFKNNEVIEVKTNFKFNGVEHYKISTVDTVAAGTMYNDNKELTNGFFQLIGIAGIIMILYYIF